MCFRWPVPWIWKCLCGDTKWNRMPTLLFMRLIKHGLINSAFFYLGGGVFYSSTDHWQSTAVTFSHNYKQAVPVSGKAAEQSLQLLPRATVSTHHSHERKRHFIWEKTGQLSQCGLGRRLANDLPELLQIFKLHFLGAQMAWNIVSSGNTSWICLAQISIKIWP